jgi:hypothetical protein
MQHFLPKMLHLVFERALSIIISETPKNGPTSGRRFHKDGTLPQAGEVFVFGSNMAGRHGKGAAEIARKQFGAIQWQGYGRMGRSYGIPTKDGRPNTFPLSDPRATLSLDVIRSYVYQFIEYARTNPEEDFFVTRIGCALAGYTNKEIAPMFAGAPVNCSFAEE